MPHTPLQKIVHWVSDRGVCGYCLSRTIPPSAFGSHRLAAARSHSGSDNTLCCHSLPSCRFATFTQGRHGWESVHSVGNRVVRTYTVGADSISARFVRNRIICGYRMLFTGGKTDYTKQTDNCPWQLSAGISNKLQIRNNVTKCPTPLLRVIRSFGG